MIFPQLHDVPWLSHLFFKQLLVGTAFDMPDVYFRCSSNWNLFNFSKMVRSRKHLCWSRDETVRSKSVRPKRQGNEKGGRSSRWGSTYYPENKHYFPATVLCASVVCLFCLVRAVVLSVRWLVLCLKRKVGPDYCTWRSLQYRSN
jgi:hypothetical protein